MTVILQTTQLKNYVEVNLSPLISFRMIFYEKGIQLMDALACLKCTVVPRLGRLAAPLFLAALRALDICIANSGVGDVYMESHVFG